MKNQSQIGGKWTRWAALGVALVAGAAPLPVSGQSMAHVPGVVIGYEPSPSLLDIILGRDKYICDPCIAVLPNGDYIATHALFGDGADADISGTTKVFRSTDKGLTWSQLHTFSGYYRCSLFTLPDLPVEVVFRDGLDNEYLAAAYAGTRETTIRSNAANRSYGADTNFQARRWLVGDTTHEARGLLRFDLSSLTGAVNPADIAEVRLDARLMQADADLPPAGATFHLYAMKAANGGWIEGASSNPALAGEPTWNNFQYPSTAWAGGAGGGAPGGATYDDAVLATLVAPGGTKREVSFTFTPAGVAAARQWVASPAANYGMLMAVAGDALCWAQLASRESATAAYRPRLYLRLSTLREGGLYLGGSDKDGAGSVGVLRKSTDNGVTWGATATLANGFGGTPNNPVTHAGRLWCAMTLQTRSAPPGSNLALDSSWKISNGVTTDPGWFDGKFQGMTEGQVVASPEQGVAVLPKVRGLPYTALIRADLDTGNVSFDSANDFIPLPGGEKKFGAAFDPVSGRFFVLSNPVLEAHRDDPNWGDEPEMIRNTAAVITSRDLRAWTVEKIFLYSPNINYEAFQYLNFKFDGDDMVVASRTAFDVGGNKPPRGHDSNLMTFHRIPNARNLRPHFALLIETAANRVSRVENTQHKRAPLGRFTLGATFAGAALSQPVGVAQGADGEVFIQEQGGRILRFDALGNFIALADGAPGPFAGGELAIEPPAPGECCWVRPGGGDWAEPANWFYWGRPDTPAEVATLGSAAEAPCVLTVHRAFVLRGLRWRNAQAYTIAGAGELRLEAEAGRGVLDAQEGAHVIQVPLRLLCDTDLSVAAGASLTLDGALDLAGRRLAVAGPGRLAIRGALALGGGVLAVTAESPVALDNPTSAVLDGALEFAPPPGAALVAGASFTLLEFSQPIGPFAQLILPALPAGLQWDTSALGVDGKVAIVAGPPPAPAPASAWKLH